MIIRRRITQIFAGFAIAAGLAIAPTSAALAAPVTAISANALAAVPAAAIDEGDYQPEDAELNDAFVNNGYLPINRWYAPASKFHDKFDGFVAAQITEKMQRGTTQTLGMLAGNQFWSWTGELTKTAVTFDVLDVAGAAVDNAAGNLGQTVVNTPGLLIPIAGSLIVIVFWGAMRGRGQKGTLKRIGGIIIIIALVAVMSAAATRSTTEGGQFKPGVGSPGWAVKAVSDSVSTLATAPTSALIGIESINGTGTDYAGPFTCVGFENAMDERSKTVDAGAGVSEQTKTDVSSVTRVVNGLWQVTGLQTWRSAQFGSSNPYANYSYCRMLELDSPAATLANTHTLMKLSAGQPTGAGTGNLTGTVGPRGAVFKASNAEQVDALMIAWAACRTNDGTSWDVANGWRTHADGSAWITTADCATWWASDKDATVVANFKIGGSTEDIEKLTEDPRVLNYVKSLHGNDVMEGTTAVTAYVVSAALMLAVFGGLSLAVIGAKLFLLMFMIVLFIIMIASLFSKNPMGEKLVGLGQQFIGVTVFAFGFTLILGVVTMMTKILVEFAATMWGAGNPFSLIWAGFAPVISIVALNFVFQKVLKLPSPMTASGAVAWGTAGGATGAAIGTGTVGRLMNRGASAVSSVKNAAGRSARNAVNDTADGALHAVSGGRVGKQRRGAMDGGNRTAATDGTHTRTAGVGTETLGAKVDPSASRREQRTTERAEMRDARDAHFAKNPAEAAKTVGGRTAAATAFIGAGATGAAAGVAAVTKWKSAEPAVRQQMMAAGRAQMAAGQTAAKAKLGASVQKGFGLNDEQKSAFDAARNSHQAWQSPAVAKANAAKETEAKVAAAATGVAKTVGRAAKYTALGLVAVSGPVGTAAVVGYTVNRGRNKLSARRTMREGWLQEHRAEQAAAERAAAARKEPKPSRHANRPPNPRAAPGRGD